MNRMVPAEPIRVGRSTPLAVPARGNASERHPQLQRYDMDKLYVSNADASVRMLQSDFLEKLTRVHWAVPHMVFLPVIGYMLYAGYRSGIEPGRGAFLFLRLQPFPTGYISTISSRTACTMSIPMTRSGS